MALPRGQRRPGCPPPGGFHQATDLIAWRMATRGDVTVPFEITLARMGVERVFAGLSVARRAATGATRRRRSSVGE